MDESLPPAVQALISEVETLRQPTCSLMEVKKYLLAAEKIRCAAGKTGDDHDSSVGFYEAVDPLIAAAEKVMPSIADLGVAWVYVAAILTILPDSEHKVCQMQDKLRKEKKLSEDPQYFKQLRLDIWLKISVASYLKNLESFLPNGFGEFKRRLQKIACEKHNLPISDDPLRHELQHLKRDVTKWTRKIEEGADPNIDLGRIKRLGNMLDNVLSMYLKCCTAKNMILSSKEAMDYLRPSGKQSAS